MAQGQKKGSRRIRYGRKLWKLVKKDQQSSYWALLVVEEVKEDEERTSFGKRRKEKRPCKAMGIRHEGSRMRIIIRWFRGVSWRREELENQRVELNKERKRKFWQQSAQTVHIQTLEQSQRTAQGVAVVQSTVRVLWGVLNHVLIYLLVIKILYVV